MPRLGKQSRLLAGVAGGIADEIGIDILIIRLSFVVLTAAGGWGAILYGLSWGVMAWVEKSRPAHIFHQRPKGRSERERTVAVVFVVGGLLLAVKDLGPGFEDAVVWPLVMLGAGFVLAWRRVFPENQTELVRRPWQILAGAVLMLMSVVWTVQSNFDMKAAASVALALGLMTISAVLLFGPVGYRLWTNLVEERRLRIRSEEKADMAAHLHDSVLQTLTLMQQSSDDPQQVAALARRQERELREWLYGNEPGDGPQQFRAALSAAAVAVELAHKVIIEVVVVGDAVVDRPLETLLGAAREAMTNAARHSGVQRVDVYAEVTVELVEVFVRDLGCGFILDEVPEDRRGVAESLLGRMARIGGNATIDTAPDQGTEVRLSLSLNPGAAS